MIDTILLCYTKLSTITAIQLLLVPFEWQILQALHMLDVNSIHDPTNVLHEHYVDISVFMISLKCYFMYVLWRIHAT
jgi:hypothetical protein